MSAIPARRLTSNDLSMLGRNTVAAAKADPGSGNSDVPKPSASLSTAGDEPIEPEPFESVIDKAIRSQHVAG